MRRRTRTEKPETFPLDLAPQELNPDTVYVFTDGSCSRVKNGVGVGGWAAVLIKGDYRKEFSGSEVDTTVNRMELTAILRGITALNPLDESRVEIYSDSQHCVNSIVSWAPRWARAGWVGANGQPVLNQDLLSAILTAFTPRMRIGWVKGHAEHCHNERADHLAREARMALQERCRPVESLCEDDLSDLIYGEDLARAIAVSRGRQRDLMRKEANERLAARVPAPKGRIRHRKSLGTVEREGREYLARQAIENACE